MALIRIELSPLQNGLHSIYHAVEHLDEALAEADAFDANAYDPSDCSIRHARRDGTTSWYVGSGYAMPPKAYGIKFSILHLIHGVELIVKSYLERENPGGTRLAGSSSRTMGMRAAVRELMKLRPELLDPGHLELVLRSGEFRNEIEHASFAMPWDAVTRLALDFLSVANYLAFALHDVRLAEVFEFDPYREGGDNVGPAITALLSERSALTQAIVEKFAADWSQRRPSEKLLYCLQCGARGVGAAEGICVVCGASGEVEIGLLLDDLDAAAEAITAGTRRSSSVPPVG